MLDFEAAKRVAYERWLSVFAGEPGGPLVIQDDQCEEYEWGWLIAWRHSDPDKVPAEKRRRIRMVLVDRVTGNIKTVGTSGPRMAILRLLEGRPTFSQSPDIVQENIGPLTKATVSMRVFTPLKELQIGNPEQEESIVLFQLPESSLKKP